MAINTGVIDNRFCERRAKMPVFCAYQLGIKTGQRKNERRLVRGKQAYVDTYPANLMFCVIGIMVLSSLDAFLTLDILAQGGKELNALMAILIEGNVAKFVGFKLALTSLALILLTIHHNVLIAGKIRVHHLQYVMLAGYSILISYEIILLGLI